MLLCSEEVRLHPACSWGPEAGTEGGILAPMKPLGLIHYPTLSEPPHVTPAVYGRVKS